MPCASGRARSTGSSALDSAEAGSFVQSRITGAFEGIRDKLKDLPADRYLRLEGRGMREPSRKRHG